jgi:hypothetical protein
MRVRSLTIKIRTKGICIKTIHRAISLFCDALRWFF